MPTEISSTLHFRTLLSSHTYLIADFYATWCPPCKQIAPIYAQLSTTHSTPSKLAFVKVNVDEQTELAGQYGIQAMPTFLVFKNGNVIETIKGANPPAIKAAVQKAVADTKAATPAQTQLPKSEEAEEVKKEQKKSVEGLSMAERLGLKTPSG